MTDKIVVITNCGSAEEADKIARALLDLRLAACVNILPKVRSLYHWQGAIAEEEEWTLLIKTRRALFEPLCQELRRIHSYTTPEAIAIPIVDGLPEYVDWISRETERAEAAEE